MEAMQSSFSLMGMWATMNWVARSVVFVLAIMSVWSLTIAFERAWRFYKARAQSVALAREITPLLKEHNLGEAIIRTRDTRFRDSHLARVLHAGLAEFQADKKEELPADFDIAASGKRHRA
jgi:biopolymer transport protein ExbB/TolQ